MNGLAAHLLLAILWMLMVESFTPGNLVAGLAIGLAILWLVGGADAAYPRRCARAARLVGFVAWESIRANLRVMRQVLSPLRGLHPVILAIPMQAETALEITVLANVVTIVPGSFSLDVDLERRVLYVHVMHADDVEAARREITECFERRLLEVLRVMSEAAILHVGVAAATTLLGVAALLAFTRLVRGPSAPDRVLSLDLMGNLTVGAIALYAIAADEPLYLRAAIVLALLSFLGTVAFAYFVEQRGRP